MWSFHCPLLRESRLTFLALIYEPCTEYCQPGKLTWTLVSKVFIGALSHIHSWPPTWWISVFRPLENRGDTMWLKALVLNHVDLAQSLQVTLLQSGWAKTLRQKKGPFYQANNSRSYRLLLRSQKQKIDLSLGKIKFLTIHLVKYEWPHF